VRAGNVADGATHGQNHEAEGELNANVRNRAAGYIVNDDYTHPDKMRQKVTEHSASKFFISFR